MNTLGSPFAFAESYLLNRSYFEDKTNTLTLAQVEQQAFTPYPDVLTAGYQPGTFWLKLKIAASTDQLVLKIRPVFTEEIELFDPAQSQGKPLAGNKHPWSASDLEGVSYNFLLAPKQSERDIYLRIKSVRSYLVKVDVMTMAQYQKQDRFELLVYAGYSTFTFLLALWLFVTWLMHRELVLGLFTLQQCVAFLHTLFHGGLARIFFDDHLDPVKTNYFFSTLVVIYPLVSILANKFLLQEYGLKKFYRYGLSLLMLLSCGIITLHFSSNLPLTFNLNSILVFVLILFLLVSALFGVDLTQSTLRADALSIRTLRIFYTFNIVLWTLAILTLQGLLPGGEIALHSLHIYSMLSGLIFFFLLQYRARALLEIETGRASALKAEADHERQQREEQAMLMAMLSHEIKTPLSVLKLVVDEKVTGSDLEGHANRAVSNIDFIVDRCLQLGKLDAKEMHAKKKELHIHQFLTELIIEYRAENRFKIECPQHLVGLTDPEIMRVIISNLVENALKYSLPGSIIFIKARPQPNHEESGIQISMTNETGLMGEPDPDHVFKKYYRNTSATKISGSGLGLYLVHELIRVLGGKIEYQPKNKLVIFTLWIPT